MSELRVEKEKAKAIKAKLQELEKENQGLHSEIEKDRALFEDKIRFLMDQKARLEGEKVDNERRLKEEQENLQRIRNIEKEKANKNRQECVTHLETYYKQLTQRIQDEGKKAAEDGLVRIKALQESNQELTTQLEILKRERDANGKASNDRAEKQDRVENSLRQEIVVMKTQHETAAKKFEEKLD